MENYNDIEKTENGTCLKLMKEDMPEEKLVEIAIENLNVFKKIYADAYECLLHSSNCAYHYPEIFRKICPELVDPLIEAHCKACLDEGIDREMLIINNIIMCHSIENIDSPFNTFKKH